jgi:periplasmic copper chaperone A
MKKFGILAVVSLFVAVTLSGAASASNYKVGALEIVNPWSRAVPNDAKVAAAYMKIRNTGTEPDRLVSGSTPVAGRFEIHEIRMDKENGVVRMRPLPSGLEIRPREIVELKPSSFHVMMTDLKQPIQLGKPFKASLVFEKAGKVDVDFTVIAASATSAAPAHDEHRH